MGRGASKASAAGGGTNPAVEKTLNQIIKRTQNLKKEQYRIVNEDGEVVLTKQGEKDNVKMTVGEHRQYTEGATTIHNHPQIDEGLGGPPSPSDIKDFGYGAREIVIASNEGTYRLKNTKYGTPQERDGWRPLQEALQKIADDQSSVAIIRKSNDIMANSKTGKEMHKISETWVKRKSEGASQAELDKYMSKFDSLQKQYKTELGQLRRKMELEPYHEFYKKNAKKYGFSYTYPKGAY